MLNKIKKIFTDSHKEALKAGMVEGERVSVMGGVNFGSEPYLIKLGDDVRISFDVTFVNHDGGTWAFRDRKEYRKSAVPHPEREGSHYRISRRCGKNTA